MDESQIAAVLAAIGSPLALELVRRWFAAYTKGRELAEKRDVLGAKSEHVQRQELQGRIDELEAREGKRYEYLEREIVATNHRLNEALVQTYQLKAENTILTNNYTRLNAEYETLQGKYEHLKGQYETLRLRLGVDQ